MKDIVRHIAASLRLWKLIILVYVSQLILASVIGIGVYGLLKSNLGNSGSLLTLAEGWDYKAIQDFLYHKATAVSGLQGRLLPLLLMYLFISGVISSGIWVTVYRHRFDFPSFIAGIHRYAIRFFSLTIIASVIFLVWTAIIWFPFISQAMTLLEEKPDERFVYFLGLGLLLFWLIGVLLLMTFVYTVRVRFIHGDYSLLRGMISALKQTRPTWLRTLGAITLITLCGGFLVYLTVWWEALVGISAAGLILISIVFNQLIVLARIILRLGLISYVLRCSQPEDHPNLGTNP